MSHWFHVKHSPLAVLPLLLVPLLLAACGIGDNADGWAAPLLVPDVVIDERERDLIIFAAGRDRIAAIDPTDSTGELIWEFPDPARDNRFRGLDEEVPTGAFYGDPTLLGQDEILVGTWSDGKVYAIRIDGSSARLIFDTADSVVASVVADDRVAYIATTDKRVIAVDTDNPEEDLWTFDDLANEVWGTPALAQSREHGQLLIVPALDGTIHALRTADGGEVWRFQAGAGIGSDAVVADGRLFIGSFDRRFYAIDIEDGTEIWSREGRDWFWTSALIRDGTVYAADLAGSVWAWDAATGDERWAEPYDAGGAIRARPLLMADGEMLVLVVMTRAGKAHAIDSGRGTEVWVSPFEELDSLFYANPLALGTSIGSPFLVANEAGELYEIQVNRDDARECFPDPKPAQPCTAPDGGGSA